MSSDGKQSAWIGRLGPAAYDFRSKPDVLFYYEKLIVV